MEDIINMIHLCDENPELANDLIKNIKSYPEYLGKQFICLPAVTYVFKSLTTLHINRMVSLRGTHIRAYQVLFKNVMSKMTCLKCNNTTFSETNKLKNDKKICSSCGSNSIHIDRDFNKAVSSQTIRIQNLTNGSTMSETIEILLEGENVNKFKPGDKLFITGIVFRKWKQLRINEPMISTLCVRAISIVKEEDDDVANRETNDLVNHVMKFERFERRKFLIKSFCDEIEGNDNVKLGLLLGMLGGGKSMRRKNIHVLLFGESGTGKSHLLKAVSKMVIPGVFVNGIGTSDAGLTSCAMRQGKDWSIEAGAVILADNGVCCIDQFHKLKVSEKSGLLEAMEQQTVSVAKAGMVVSLNARCSVFASVTTGINFEYGKKISEGLGISTPLVSRFDLIFGIFDSRNENDECLKAEKLLRRGRENKKRNLSRNRVKLYILLTRKKFPRIEDHESELLMKYYTKKRKENGPNEYNTIRMFESLIRLSEAHAKLMNMDVVTEDDVYVAMILLETTINGDKTMAIDIKKIFKDEIYFNIIKQKIKDYYEL